MWFLPRAAVALLLCPGLWSCSPYGTPEGPASSPPNVGAAFEQMGRETVPQGVARRRFGQSRQPHVVFDRPLQTVLGHVVPPHDARPRIGGQTLGRKYPLPGPLFARVGDLNLEALGAWFWVDAATFRSWARCVRNAVTSTAPHFLRMPLIVEEDKALDPAPINSYKIWPLSRDVRLG